MFPTIVPPPRGRKLPLIFDPPPVCVQAIAVVPTVIGVTIVAVLICHAVDAPAVPSWMAVLMPQRIFPLWLQSTALVRTQFVAPVPTVVTV